MSRERLITAKRYVVMKAYLNGQSGLSLVELMIGLLIGLILLGGVLQTMLASKQASSARQSMATVTDNARFLFDFMGRDLRMIGRGFSVASAPLSYTSASGLVAKYYTPASGGGESLVEVTFKRDGNEIKYTRVEDGSVKVNNEILIDRVDGFDFSFGYVTDATGSTLAYSAYDSLPAPASVVAIRTKVTFENVASGDFIFNAASTPLVSTFALRNRVATLIDQ